MNNKLISLIFCMIFLFSMVSADKIIQESRDTEVQINFPLFNYFKLNKETILSFHAINTTDGLRFNNTQMTCYGQIFNNDGLCIYPRQELIWDTTYEAWNIVTTFPDVGEYQITVYCNNSQDGFASSTASVTWSGLPIIEELFALFFILISLITGMVVFNNTEEKKMNIKSDWNQLKLFGESIKEYRLMPNWILSVLILMNISTIFLSLGFDVLYTLFIGLFYLSLIVGIPIVIMFALKFLDARKRLNDLVDWGSSE